MEAYQQPNPYPASPRTIRVVNLLIAALILALIAMVAIKAVSAQDHGLCRAVSNAQVSRAGHLAEWDASRNAWKDMPDDLGAIPIDLLYTDESLQSAYYLMFSHTEQELWVFPFWSLEADDTGTHNLCPVLVYDLSLEHR